MTDESAILRVICDHPDDDTPRLVYSDYLEDNDQFERAEFIRVQIALARLEKPNSSGILRRREQILFAGVREWIPEQWIISDRRWTKLGWRLSIRLATATIDLHWSRGFACAVTCTFDDWELHAAAIRAMAPIHQVTLTTMPPVERHETDPWRYRIPGREWYDVPHGGPTSDWLCGARWLCEAEWFPVKFTLPVTADEFSRITGQMMMESVVAQYGH